MRGLCPHTLRIPLGLITAVTFKTGYNCRVSFLPSFLEPAPYRAREDYVSVKEAKRMKGGKEAEIRTRIGVTCKGFPDGKDPPRSFPSPNHLLVFQSAVGLAVRYDALLLSWQPR